MTDNTERSVAEVGVTQADRDRAADYAERHIRMLGLADRYRSGVFDDDLVQAFARHRTEAEARVGEVDRAAAMLACRITGWNGVASRLEQGWIPEPGTSEANLLELFARHRTRVREVDQIRASFPERIGRLTLGERLTEDHYCGGSHEVPDGQPIYWQERGGEYPDDIDGYCLSCAIQQAESDAGWCECSIQAALKPTEPTEFSSGISMSEEDTDPKRLGEPTEPSEAKVNPPACSPPLPKPLAAPRTAAHAMRQPDDRR